LYTRQLWGFLKVTLNVIKSDWFKSCLVSKIDFPTTMIHKLA